MKTFKLFFILGISVYLSGCASPAKMENMIFSGDQKTYPKEINKNIELGNVSGGEETNPMWTSEIDDKSFAGAVMASLKAQGLYSEKGSYQLAVQMLKVDQPAFGFDLTVTTHVRYTLTKKDSNLLVLDETVIAEHTSGVSDAFVAVERLRLANEGSAKKNIEGLLVKLAELTIDPSQISLAQ